MPVANTPPQDEDRGFSPLLEAFYRAGHLVAARREVRQAPSAYQALTELGFPEWAIAEVAEVVAFDEEPESDSKTTGSEATSSDPSQIVRDFH